MDTVVIAYIAVIVVLLAFSAFFSMSETAFTSVNQVRLKKMAKDGDKKAARALKILENYDKFLTTILIGNNLVNIGASSLATVMFGVILVGYASSTVSLTSTIVMTIIVLTFGEITPKTLAKKNPEKYTIKLCTTIHHIEVVFTPFSWIFTKFTNAIGRKGGGSPTMTEDELEVMIDEIEDDGVIEKSEGQLIKSAIRFDDTQVGEVFVPRVDVIAIPSDAAPDEVGAVFSSSGFSRIPVYRNSIDDIIGVVYAKEYYSNRFCGKDLKLEDIVHPVKYVPETMSIATVLNDFQKSKIHIAVVLDAYGGTMGIITLEDILEELVGDIWDESDTIQQDVSPVGSSMFIVKGNANIFDAMETMNVDFDPEEYEDYSVSGYVMYKLGRYPVKGDSISTPRYDITVRSAKGRRALECLFEIKEPQEDPSEEE